MFAKIFKEMETASGANQDPDAAQDIDRKLNKKRKPGNNVPVGTPDYLGQSPSLAGNTKKSDLLGFFSVLKGPKHPGFDAVAAGIAQSDGVPLDEAKAMLAAGTRRAGSAARKKNPRLNRVAKGFLAIFKLTA